MRAASVRILVGSPVVELGVILALLKRPWRTVLNFGVECAEASRSVAEGGDLVLIHRRAPDLAVMSKTIEAIGRPAEVLVAAEFAGAVQNAGSSWAADNTVEVVRKRLAEWNSLAATSLPAGQ